MTTPDTSAATSSRSGQLSGAMSSDTPEHFISHSPARPVAGEATPGLLRPTASGTGGSALIAARERVSFVEARCEAMQASYDATRSHAAHHRLRCARNALLVAESELSTLEQESRIARGGW